MPRTDPTSPRKEPSQERSRKTVEAILTATSRVLVREGYEAATTTRVAAVAGVSIGSLYQYFSSRDALLTALVDRHCDRIVELVGGSVELDPKAPLAEVVRALMAGVLAIHAVDPELHAVLTQHGLPIEGFRRVRALNARNQALVQTFLERRLVRVRPKNARLAAFILVRSIQAVISAAVMEKAFRLDDEELLDELCALVLRFLEVSGAGRPGVSPP
jgi:AcrR family transcriptional regulator